VISAECRYRTLAWWHESGDPSWAETRGWAAIAIAADRKSDMNAELLNLIYRDVSEMKTTLLPDVATLNTEVAAHGDIQREHGEMLREILARLA
jgi:hypothetical protein